MRLGRNSDFHNYFVTGNITDKSIISSLDNANIFPLYLHDSTREGSLFGSEDGRPNLSEEIAKNIANAAGMEYTANENTKGHVVTPLRIFDYLYAVLYSEKYRNRFKEFLKIDFPKIPYPSGKSQFMDLVSLGSELRKVHLMIDCESWRYITKYPIAGSNKIEKVEFVDDRIFINANQYFLGVTEALFEKSIGGYQPAKKWLKDRMDQILTFDDISHYQRIIIALSRTSSISTKIDECIL